MRWRQANILASGFRVRQRPDASFFPPSPPRILDDWPWEIVSSHSSATAPESHGNSSHRSTLKTDKELRSEVADGVHRLKTYFAPNRCAASRSGDFQIADQLKRRLQTAAP